MLALSVNIDINKACWSSCQKAVHGTNADIGVGSSVRARDEPVAWMCFCRSVLGKLPGEDSLQGGAGHGHGSQAVGRDRAPAGSGHEV